MNRRPQTEPAIAETETIRRHPNQPQVEPATATATATAKRVLPRETCPAMTRPARTATHGRTPPRMPPPATGWLPRHGFLSPRRQQPRVTPRLPRSPRWHISRISPPIARISPRIWPRYRSWIRNPNSYHSSAAAAREKIQRNMHSLISVATHCELNRDDAQPVYCDCDPAMKPNADCDRVTAANREGPSAI